MFKKYHAEARFTMLLWFSFFKFSRNIIGAEYVFFVKNVPIETKRLRLRLYVKLKN